MTSEIPPAARFDRSYVVVFADEATALAMDREAPGDASRVFLWALGGGLSFQQWRTISQVAVGRALGCSHSNVSRCLAHLLHRGLLERVGAGPRQQWRLTEAGGWRGKAGQYHRAKRERFAVIEGGQQDEDAPPVDPRFIHGRGDE